MRHVIVLLTAAAVLLAAPRLPAQPPSTERATDSGRPAWMTTWSPLAPIAEHPRRLPRAPGEPEILLAPSPRVGLFWTAGNPAGLAFETTEGWSDLRLSGGWDDGRYHRPLDPDDGGAIQFSGLGWQPLGDRGAAAGRVIVGQETQGMASFADVVEPHTSSPLVLSDSSMPEMRRMRARLEGALGWRFGGWGLGLAVGVEVRDDRTQHARFPRVGRLSAQGVSLGLTRELPIVPLRLAAYGRWLGGSERITLVAHPGTGLAYLLDGYNEPDRREVAQAYFRRIERDAWSLGLGLSGDLWGAPWTIFGERTDRDDAYSSERRAHPATDRWKATGWVLGGALQRPLFGERLLVTAQARYSRLRGAATRFDLEGDIFRSEESVLVAGADVRYASPPWTAATLFSLGRESRARHDYIVRVRSEITQWTPGLGVGVARAIGPATTASLGLAFCAYSATSILPNPEAMGPVYNLLIAPELALYATRAVPLMASITLRHQLGASTAIYLRALRESLEPSGSESTPLAPTGERTLWSVSLGVVMGPGSRWGSVSQ